MREVYWISALVVTMAGHPILAAILLLLAGEIIAPTKKDK